jgi:hypothetical protein
MPAAPLLFALLAPAHALPVTVQATRTEWVWPGEQPPTGGADAATVKLRNPATGQRFTARGTLRAVERTASGEATVRFTGDPAGEVRAWDLVYLDVNGDILGEVEPIEVAFDAAGRASLAGGGGGRLLALSGGEADPWGEGWAATLQLELRDAGVDAVYIGLIEREPGGPGLVEDLSLHTFDATEAAAVLAMGLQAMVPLERFHTVLEGELEVEGLAIRKSGAVEGGAALLWDLRFTAGGAPTAGGALRYLEALSLEGGLKPQLSPVRLRNDDLSPAATSAAYTLRLPGDLRGLELAASLEAHGDGGLEAASDVVMLEPSGVTAGATLEWEVPEAEARPPEGVYTVVVRNNLGEPASTHQCTFSPTAATMAEPEREAWTGSCTEDPRGVQLRTLKYKDQKMGSIKRRRAIIEVGGAKVGQRQEDTTCGRGGCTTVVRAVLEGSVELTDPEGAILASAPVGVAETEWRLPFAFDGDVGDLKARLLVELEAPSEPELRWQIDGEVAVGVVGDSPRFALSTEAKASQTSGQYVILGLDTALSLSAGAAPGTLVLSSPDPSDPGASPPVYRERLRAVPHTEIVIFAFH